MPHTIPPQLIQISNHYGNNPDFVLAGGGNTSYKDGRHMYIKASGQSLARITADGFAVMDMSKLAEILTKTYSDDNDKRESEVLADMISAQAESDLPQKRPSVETLLHCIMPQKYVIHTHPALVNAILCTPNSKRLTAEILGDSVIWIESIMPGYILSKRIEKEIADCGDVPPRCIVLENHGIFVAADTAEEIHEIYSDVVAGINQHVKIKPNFSETKTINVGGKDFLTNTEIARFVESKEAFAPISSVFSPDHLVYCGERPVFLESIDDLDNEVALFTERYKKSPKIIALRGVGVFSVNETAKQLFLDTVKIAVYTRNFNSVQFLSDGMIDFISNWEVEKYRSKVSG